MKKDNKFLYSLLLSNKVVIMIHNVLTPTLTFKYIYINSQNLEKIQLNFNWILNFVSRISFNFLILCQLN